MTKIKITTTQNIDIEYELATVFDRMVAWLIDIVLVLGYVLIASTISGLFFKEEDSMAQMAFVTPIALYHLVSEWLWNGQSVGKKAMGIKVIRLDGSPAHIGNYLSRWIMRPFECSPIFFYGSVGIGAVTLNPQGQRIGDMIAGTVVIRAGRKMSLRDTLFSETPEDYEMRFPEVYRLMDRDVSTLKEVLLLFRKEGNRKLLNIAANRICHILDVVPPGNMNSEQFLRTVLQDYSHLS